MTKISEELQARVTDSKIRLEEATKTFQSAQQAFQTAQQDHNVWSLALQAELRDEQRKAAAATENQLQLPTSKPEPSLVVSHPQEAVIVDPSEVLNKTDFVRELLRQHPSGMTAPEIWKEVSDQFKHRPYLYSVLKRLRDKDEVTKKRAKYYLKLATRIEEVRENRPIVQ